MRRMVPPQLPLVAPFVAQTMGRELATISGHLDQILDDRLLGLIKADLTADLTSPERGREGLSADLTLRVLILKQRFDLSYDELEFHLADSRSMRAFCRLGWDEKPSRSALQRSCKRLSASTLEAINQQLLRRAVEDGIESGSTIRTDCTVTETNIHAPSDSSLLNDCVRVLTRLLTNAQEVGVEFAFGDHTRRAKRRAIGIQHARRKKARVPLYRDLVRVTKSVLGYAEAALAGLDKMKGAAHQALRDQLQRHLELGERVVDQTTRRVFAGETVPATEKVLSIFEDHTDIIIKDWRDTHYGHKLCLSSGVSGLVTDLVVESGNPADSTLAVRAAERHLKVYGAVPVEMAFDGGFASRANLDELKALGVSEVCFAKGRGLTVDEMASSARVYRRLRNFRAGIEAGISRLKRAFGLSRCRWRGLASFHTHAWASVLAANLLTLARIGPA